MVDIVKRFIGPLEMLPNYQEGFDFFAAATWQSLAKQDNERWNPAEPEDLARARATRDLLDRQITERALPIERMRYIAGCAPETPARLVPGKPPSSSSDVDEDWPAQVRDDAFHFQASALGDGRVLWENGIPQGVMTWYSEAAHGDLAAAEDNFPAILDLLQHGTTQRLPTEPPARAARAAAAPAVMRSAPVPYVPDNPLLRAYALGSAPGKRRARAAVPRFNVTIAHGNLLYARYPVAVGHYHGDTIISAELALDRQLNGRLRQRRDLDMYPGPIGSSCVFLGDKFPGAIVIGLGRVGELAPGSLVSAFSAAMLEYALAQMEAARNADRTDAELPICVSTLLIGTTAGGLTLRDSMVSLIAGVGDANRALAQSGKRARIDTVEFLELWEDRAIEAARLLDELRGEPELGKLFTPVGGIASLRGRRRRAYFSEDRDWWARLQIVAESAGALTFTRLTDRARAEVSLLPTQRSVVHGFLGNATRDVQIDPAVARTLFELMLPNELKNLAPESRNTVLVVDNEAAQYPWELIEDGLARDRAGEYVPRSDSGDGIKPMAIRAGLIRQRRTDSYRAEPRMSLGNVALVVGNPRLDWEIFPDLPGATAEAQGVARALLRRGFAVTENIARDADSILRDLFARPYRIVHMAGHGVQGFVRGGPADATGWVEASRGGAAQIHLEQTARGARDGDYEHPRFHVEFAPAGGQAFQFAQTDSVSGMVLGRDVFLTPTEIRQMRAVPDLVFVNCCYGAKETVAARDRSRLAASIATQLIEIGVRAVVAAGWAVDDAAAAQFAATFYERMLAGSTFGRAVLAARRRIYHDHPRVNTWGAYQCYGDPDFRLFVGDDSDATAQQPKFSVLAEAVAEAENLRQLALSAHTDNLGWIESRLDDVARVAFAQWPQCGELRCALARAYAEINQLGKAIEHYRAPLAAGSGDITMRDIEQLANLELRYACELVRAGKPSPRSPRPKSGAPARPPTAALPEQMLDDAQRLLTQLAAFSSSSERFALQGGLHKRRAAIAAHGGNSALSELEKMARCYRAAIAQTGDVSARSEPYPVTNFISAELMSAKQIATRQRAQWHARINDAERVARLRLAELRDFWSRSAVADCALLRALIDDALAAAAEAIIGEYREAQNRGASPKEWRSVIENLEFLIDVAPQSVLSASSRDALDRIHESLKLFSAAT